jgi:hypothetical protein
MVENTSKKTLDRYCDTFLASGDQVAQNNLKAGAPITYRDDENRLVKEYPDGSKEILEEAD